MSSFNVFGPMACMILVPFPRFYIPCIALDSEANTAYLWILRNDSKSCTPVDSPPFQYCFLYPVSSLLMTFSFPDLPFSSESQITYLNEAVEAREPLPSIRSMPDAR